MTDISKCNGIGCNLKESCWRFLAPANPYRQSYFIPDNVGSECDMFWSHSGSKLFKEVCSLKKGWLDGEGQAIAISPEFVERCAMAFEAAGFGSPAIFPSDDGGVRFEWCNGACITVELDDQWMKRMKAFKKKLKSKGGVK